MTTIALHHPPSALRRLRQRLAIAAHRRPSAHSTPKRPQVVLLVELCEPNGGRWEAIGGGATVAEAIEFALASAPADRKWKPVSWTEPYSD
jgi:hypothetical protein